LPCIPAHVPPFDTVAQAAIAVAPVPWPNNVTEIDSGYVIVDTAVAYSVPRGVRRLTISSQLAPGALGEAATVNLVVDHRDGDAVYYRTTGLLTEPLVIAPGPLEGAGTFVRGGIDRAAGNPSKFGITLRGIPVNSESLCRESE
jgi:hypothetical protein